MLMLCGRTRRAAAFKTDTETTTVLVLYDKDICITLSETVIQLNVTKDVKYNELSTKYRETSASNSLN